MIALCVSCNYNIWMTYNLSSQALIISPPPLSLSHSPCWCSLLPGHSPVLTSETNPPCRLVVPHYLLHTGKNACTQVWITCNCLHYDTVWLSSIEYAAIGCILLHWELPSGIWWLPQCSEFMVANVIQFTANVVIFLSMNDVRVLIKIWPQSVLLNCCITRWRYMPWLIADYKGELA